MTKKIYLLFVLSFLYLGAFAQSLQLGGLQGTQTLVLTPSAQENQKNQSIAPQAHPFLGFKAEAEGRFAYQFHPRLPKEWNWIAAFNVPLEGKKINFFYYDSWVATQLRCKTSGRLRNFDNDITQQIKSNCYHIALQRSFVAENETFMLLVSPKKQKVQVELPKEIFKTQRLLEYEMEAWEAKFVHIILPPDEYTVVTWQENPQIRKEILLKNNWKFNLGEVKDAQNPAFDDQAWQTVQVPHTWNDDMFDRRNYRDTLDITEMFERNTGWYRHTFEIPADWKGKHIKIDFLGANQVAEVWLNGKYLGKHTNGYTDFHFGITDQVYFDRPNVLAVKIDNRFDMDIPPHTADYNFQGGIYREVVLRAWNQPFVKDLHITTPKVSPQSADLALKITFNNTSSQRQKVKVVSNLINPYREIALSNISYTTLEANKKTSLSVAWSDFANPLLWSPATPYLYQIITSIYDESGKLLDEKSENFGFRFYEFTADKGFFLNGIPTKLKGVNVHQDIYGKGWAMDSTQKRQDYLWIKKMGANFVRMSHYPHHPYELYLCDSLGLMVYPEIPVVNTVGTEKFVENAVKIMEEMIVRDKNHPSILMWGVGNEYYRESFTEEVVEWALRCTEAVATKAKALDPYRPTIQAQNDLVDDRIMQYTDIQGRNRYFGWYTGAEVYAGFSTFDGFAKIMEKEHQTHPDWKILVTEYGAEGKYGYHVNEPTRFDHSETYQLAFHKAYWDFIGKNDWVLGGTIWNMFDFASWAKIGNIPHINQKGMLTYNRSPKSIFYYYQSIWTDAPMVYIFSHTWLHRTGEKGQKQPLEVFSNCQEVEVFLNGQSQGRKNKQSGYLWEVEYVLGANQVKAVGYHEGEVVKNSLTLYFSYEDASQKKKSKGSDSD